MTTANAANLGVRWAAGIYGAAVDGPVVAHDSVSGKTLAYIGTQNGDLVAVNMATGQIVWSVGLGPQVRSTPLVVNGAVWAATFNSSKVYKINASTGAIECSFTPQGVQIEGSPVAATPPGGVPTLYIAANDTNTANGPLYALNQSNCQQQWAWTGYAQTSGSWDPLSYAVDAKGEPLVLLGSSDPDSRVYAVDAVTGQEVWNFAVFDPTKLSDVGAGVVVSPPGANGFADGMAYVETKRGIMYALDLTTGAKIWDINYNKLVGAFGTDISTAALSGTNLVLGDAHGLVDLNAVTGKLVWSDHNPADVGVDGSPAIAGPAGSAVVVAGDLAGGVDVVSLATGAQLYHYQTGHYITASPAVSGGNIVIASADGFLYNFAVGGGNEATLPTATVTSPLDSSQAPNPDGDLDVTGTATDTAGLAQVVVAVQAGGSEGPWWDAATSQWVSGPIGNPATLASPGGTSSGWTFDYPVPAEGGTYQVTAYSISKMGQSSVPPALSSFSVSPSLTNALIQAKPQFVPPGTKTSVSGSGFGDSETVAIALQGTTLATATTTANGGLRATAVTIPAKSPFGLASLTVTGKTSGKTATTPVTVANQWAQAGYGPQHTGYEPNDPDPYDSVGAGSGTYLNLAWSYQSGAAVSASPAVADAVAFTPNDAGQLQAVDIHDGAPLWTWSDPSKAALDGAPAVDTSLGLVFVGANDGSLYAINTTTGQTAWSDALGGDVSTPVYSGRDIYVTTSTGVFEALSESSGKKVWSTTVAAPAPTAPAVDTSAKLVIVGETNGDIQAFSTTSGTSAWTYSTGTASPVVTPASISAKTVYFGAGNSMYAVNETSGAAVWHYGTGGQVGSSFTIQPTSQHGVILVAGAADGNLYGLNATTGALHWKANMGSPVTGVASTFVTFIFDTSSGVFGAGRITDGIRAWKYSTSAGATTAPVVSSGTVYAGGHNSDLYAFTTDGQPPS
ncbi:MAG TPA: PQQ-binding-like beta-propeller repeat protein [Streptosporangiaceae bacterium]|nr:PQQ-binding-like beta-propeller repeat protein [Streptosporangiaceae bacterium]